MTAKGYESYETNNHADLPFRLRDMRLKRQSCASVGVHQGEPRLPKPNLRDYLLPAAMAAVFVVLVVRTAWMSDDAFITLRTIQNLLNGDGLRWNLAERVQTYTHPLWLFLLAAGHAVAGEGYYTAIILSINLATAAVLVLVFGIARTPQQAFVAVAILAASKAFTDYSTSGLENPLSHFLPAVFFLIYFRATASMGRIFMLAFLAALAMLNRLDLALIVAPPLIAAIWAHRSPRAVVVAMAGLFLVAVWEIFSFTYYGFPFPNTYYAKLHTGIPLTELAGQGLYYFADSIVTDPVTLPAIGAALLSLLFLRQRSLIPIAIGVALYLLYVIRIGGDFMSGRYFTVPLFCAVVILSRLNITLTPRPALAIAAAVTIVSILFPGSPYRSDHTYGTDVRAIPGPQGIADERAYYYPRTGLLLARESAPWPAGRETELGPDELDDGVARVNRIGRVGYYLDNQDTHLVDAYGIADPLLARLPVRPGSWRVGHFERAFPAGYIESLATGVNRIEHPALRAYYEKLMLITRGRLFTWKRWQAIWGMNTGQYDHLLETYIADTADASASGAPHTAPSRQKEKPAGG